MLNPTHSIIHLCLFLSCVPQCSQCVLAWCITSQALQARVPLVIIITVIRIIIINEKPSYNNNKHNNNDDDDDSNACDLSVCTICKMCCIIFKSRMHNLHICYLNLKPQSAHFANCADSQIDATTTTTVTKLTLPFKTRDLHYRGYQKITIIIIIIIFLCHHKVLASYMPVAIQSRAL